MRTPRPHRLLLCVLPPVLLAAGAGGCTPVGVLSTLGASVATHAAEERGIDGAATDTLIDSGIRSRWLETDPDLITMVGLTVRERRVLLTGAVRTPEQRVTAVRLAWQPEDVVAVINEIRVTPEGDLGDDARDKLIATDLRSTLMLDSRVKSINYAVDVSGRVVYLFGVAQNAAERDRVRRWARQTDYVRRVIDHTLLKDDPRRVAPAEGAAVATRPAAPAATGASQGEAR